MGESSSRRQSFEWVAGHVEFLENQQNDDDSESVIKRSGKQGKGKGVAVGVKRKRSLGLDVSADSNKDGCHCRAVSDNGLEVVDLVDSPDDNEVLVSKGKEGGVGVDVDVDGVSDDESDEDVDVDGVSDDESDEDVSSAEEDDSSDESVFSIEEENECISLSVEDSSEQENEEESEVTEKNEKACKGESVEVDWKGKINADGDVLHYCSAHDTDTDVRSEQEWKEESLGIHPKGKINADGDDLHSSSDHDISDRRAKLGEAESVLVTSCTKKKSTRVPKQKRLPTIAFEAPKVECLPLRFSFAKQPTIPEKPDYEREVDALLAEYKFVIAYENASADSKAKDGYFTRSDNNRNHFNDVTYGGSPETAIDNGRTIGLQTAFNENEAAKGHDDARSKNRIHDFDDETHGGASESGFNKGSKFDVHRACKKGEEAKGNNFSRSFNSRKDDKDETYGGSRPETYKKRERVGNLTNKKGITAPKDCNAFMILVDSIYDKGEVSGELPPFGDESPQDEAPRDEPLPLFFTLGHPPSPAPEKSASEIELENLFEEYDFVQMSEEIGSTDSKLVETNDSVLPGTEVTQYMLCSQGKHDLILDEEIGLICQFCPHVHREIKYIVPDFAPNPYGKAGKRFYEEDNRSVLDDLQCNDPDNCGFSSDAHTEGTVWDLIPGMKGDMYPHQREGFEFIWSHLAGGIQLGKLAKPSACGGDGCIISHAPGTGKTRLTIIFIQSYMNFNPSSRPLIVAPRTMLLTWEEEFKKWGFDIPFHNLNNPDFTGKEDEAARNLVKDGKSSEMINLTRIVKLKSWAEKRSILGISYSLFEQICGASTKKGKHPLSPRRKLEAEQMWKVLVEFPGLVVFDEGHNPRNDQSYSWNALLKLKTRRRILLSGTPFQNNFEELYNTVRLVRPEWTTNPTCLGAFDKKQRTWGQMRGRKGNAGKGQFADDNTKRAKEVRAMISPFVHVYKGTILQDKLPGLRNSVVVLQPTALQQRCSDRIQLIKNPFKYERIEAKVTIHPSLLLNENRSMFLEEDKYSGDWERLTEIKLNPEGGVKARFAVDLIRLCQAMNERVLVFSQWVDPLLLIRDLLKSQFQWVEGEEVMYMDGKCDAKQRQSSMSYFNDPSTKAKVMLATTRGCNEGISLVGASRVVLLDVAWNPSVERQAISRAYRLGQKKIVFIYHLLMAGAREEDKYNRQVEKYRLSELVFSCSDTEADAKKIPASVAEDKILEEMVQHQKLKHIFQKITLLNEASYLDEEFV
ncbi:putative DNA helicase chromatin remodeling SNF2 family [Rosa chinensis]|uniref:Putative DNA helicase chromatin remodeling SNF2 family n=2 Tax=Rosa chinensis TaxID=74649 RepID=A0A2P6RZS4_ROSCH|nr:putative DNA helicase chromatin remodeling SNF2 family [Rosa chinensis]